MWSVKRVVIMLLSREVCMHGRQLFESCSEPNVRCVVRDHVCLFSGKFTVTSEPYLIPMTSLATCR
jgi:IS1 family transposase